MRYSFIATAFVATVFAQDLSGVPSCALVCAMKEGKAAGCGVGDIKCFCTSSAAIAATTECVNAGCSAEDATKAVAGASKLCASVGHPLGARQPEEASAAPSHAPVAEDDDEAEHKHEEKEVPVVAASTSCSTISYTKSAAPTASAPPATYTGAASQIRAGALVAVAGVLAVAL